MYFKRLEMQGFKSFADPVTIELNDGITCIVGPNGSGKSNISDAIRWVLGEQSPKSLRGGKMEDVIFAGTATRKPKGMAEVSLVIDNSFGLLPIEYKEVAVTRRMYRSGESEYMINGNICRLRDIKELFMDTGIGVDGYSIIGQGKIAEIVSTKPENRREIFEEAAGIVLYKTRKADAERKLAAANENLERVRDIINEIEGRIGGLKEESEKAKEFIDLRGRYKYLQVNIILHNIKSLEKNLNAGKDDLAEISRELEQAFAENERLEDRIEKQRIGDADLSEKYEKTNNELRAKIEELHLITNRGQINSERLVAIERDMSRLKDLIEDSEIKLSAEKNNYDELVKNESLYADEKNSAEKALNEAAAKLAEHSAKAGIAGEEIERRKDRILELSNKKVTEKAEISTLENYRKTLESRIEQIQSEHDGSDETEAKNRSRLDEITAAFDKKEKETSRTKADISEIADKIISVNNTVFEISKRFENATTELNRTIARKATIEEMENNYEGYANSVRQVMQKNFRGIIGTVSDLIEVPDGYELAIETALGAGLQNIVCVDDESAKSAIRWLKASKAGRATFLPIDSIKAEPLGVNRDISTSNGYLGIASDIIKCEDKYAKIVKYLLCRVIIADNMDSAVAMSKRSVRGFRIVTLDGEVISASGAMTGGTFRNKTANLLERKKEIDALSDRVNEIRDELDSLSKEKMSCEEEIKKLKSKRGSLYDDLQQIEVDKSVLASDREHAESLVQTANDAIRRYREETDTISADIKKADDMISKYRSQLASADKEIEQLEYGLDGLIADHMRYKEIVESDNEEIVRCRIALSEQEAKILGLNELIERVRDSLVDLEALIEDSETEYSELEEKRSLLTGSGAESEEKVKALKAEKGSLEEKIVSIQAAADKNRAESELSAREQKKLMAHIEELRDGKYKTEVKSAKNETILDTQKERLWDEFEISYAEALDMRDEAFAITSGNAEARSIKLRIAELGDVNISSIEEYGAVSKRYEFMTAQEADISKAMTELRSIILNMDKTIREKFKENFDKVVINFEESFRQLFGGGTAELLLEDESNPLESGIEIIAQPPGKKLKNINLMSGGEKTLTGIALMFAVLKAKPTPFCILDEVEAALDEANIERFSAYLKDFRDIQFALITHQKATMEHADVLYGVTMPEQGISKVLSLKLGDEVDTEGLS